MKKHNYITKETIGEWITEKPGDKAPASEIDAAEDALLSYMEANSIAPPSFLRDKILAKIGELNEQAAEPNKLELNNLPWLFENTNWVDWQEVVNGIEPPENFENIHLHTLESNDKRELFVAWVKEMVDEEVHYDLLESFLILEGSCECHISNAKGETRVVRLGQGDSISMQLGETHDIIITSLQPAKAILEWRKLAA
ncbi:MAG: hypothetical protein K9J37_01385 [Saprospiraceae bacterium]|nr:hypothetical protein [Saprospiraceae bacterium]MCF8248528.1 hypothetical protein [Saprospiraceae bacterium]MCF8283065.1 hypothetical protein [Bacteroidales bacterium]MCF8310262.1 hypothetical protein [Saprospiraceae bacterium]MCF8439299.1 hypothetical protein [Saprospiraceae bacterium]